MYRNDISESNACEGYIAFRFGISSIRYAKPSHTKTVTKSVTKDCPFKNQKSLLHLTRKSFLFFYKVSDCVSAFTATILKYCFK